MTPWRTSDSTTTICNTFCSLPRKSCSLRSTTRLQRTRRRQRSVNWRLGCQEKGSWLRCRRFNHSSIVRSRTSSNWERKEELKSMKELSMLSLPTLRNKMRWLTISEVWYRLGRELQGHQRGHSNRRELISSKASRLKCSYTAFKISTDLFIVTKLATWRHAHSRKGRDCSWTSHRFLKFPRYSTRLQPTVSQANRQLRRRNPRMQDYHSLVDSRSQVDGRRRTASKASNHLVWM